MRFEVTINDETILNDIQYEIDNMVEDEEVAFPCDDDREEFAQDCLEKILDMCENRADFFPTPQIIRDIVYDNAEIGGYLK